MFLMYENMKLKLSRKQDFTLAIVAMLKLLRIQRQRQCEISPISVHLIQRQCVNSVHLLAMV